MQKAPLPFSIRQRIGHIPDWELAKEAGCSESAITSEREQLKIEPACVIRDTSARQQRPLPLAIKALLGTAPDRELAKSTGRAESTIRTARIAHGIPKFPSATRTLDEQTIAALGTKSDADLAREAGRSESSIRSARTRRGIPTFERKIKIPRLRLQIEPPAGLIEALGTKTDCDLAVDFDLKRRWVGKMRKLLKIPKHQPVSEALRSVPESVILQLGKLSDRKLGQAHGIQPWVIRALRIERGIDPKQPKQPKRFPAKVLP